MRPGLRKGAIGRIVSDVGEVGDLQLIVAKGTDADGVGGIAGGERQGHQRQGQKPIALRPQTAVLHSHCPLRRRKQSAAVDFPRL